MAHVHYVFTGFPIPSESFARLELQGLLESGCSVSASALRSRPAAADRYLREYGLENIEISYGGPAKWLQGLWAMLRQPGRTAGLVRQLLPGFRARPKESLLGLTALPRAFGIAEELRSSNVDRVHLFWGHYPSLVGLSLKIMDNGFPVSMSLGAYDLVARYPPSALLARMVPVVTHSHANVERICDFTGLSPEQVSVIYRGVRIDDASAEAKGRRDPAGIIVAERLIPQKRSSDAITVFAHVRNRIPQAVLTVLGDGPERPGLERLVRELDLAGSVRFRGHVSHAEVRSGLARARVYLTMSCSPSERLPNAAKEAMAAGCVVVASETPGIDELVVDGVTGYVVQQGDVDGAADRIRVLLSDNDRFDQLSRNGTERIRNFFDIRATTRQRLEFWNLTRHCSSNLVLNG